MKRISALLSAIIALVVFSACKPETKPPAPETFLTLADVTGKTSYKEDSPGVRIINVKSKYLIKNNDIRAAQQKAMELAATQAVDSMVRELLPPATYNQKYAEIEQYMSQMFKIILTIKKPPEEKKSTVTPIMEWRLRLK